MHKILEFILAAAIIMSVLVATDYVIRTYVSSAQEPSNYLKTSLDIATKAIVDYILESPGAPVDWDQLNKFGLPERVGLSFINASYMISPLKVILLMTCNNTLNPFYINPYGNVAEFSRLLTGSSKYGISLELRNYFNAKLYYNGSSICLNASNYALGAGAEVLGVLKCRRISPRGGYIYYLNITTASLLINNTKGASVLSYDPFNCSFVSATTIISKGSISTVAYLINESSIGFIPLTYGEYLVLLSQLNLTKYQVNATAFYFVPTRPYPIVANVSISNITSLNISLVVANSSAITTSKTNIYSYLAYNTTLKYSPTIHTVIVGAYEKVGKSYNATAVYVVPLYPYLRVLCNGTYGLSPPTSSTPLSTINRAVKVGLFDYVFNIKVWVMRS